MFICPDVSHKYLTVFRGKMLHHVYILEKLCHGQKYNHGSKLCVGCVNRDSFLLQLGSETSQLCFLSST